MTFNYDDYIDALLNKNDTAFQKVYEASKTSVYALIRSKIRNNQVVEDLMQDTYIKAIEKLNSYKKNGKFLKWLLSIAYNLTMDYYRANKHLVESSIDDFQYSLKEDAPDYEEKAYVHALVESLSKEEKDVVLLHIVDEFTFKDIALMLHKPVGTILWIYQNSLKKMRKEAEK